MDFPSIPARIRRVAAHLTRLPPELVEPIISQLPLHDVVEISTTSPNLEAVIETSPAWSNVFEGKLQEFQQLWAAFNCMSYIWCGQPWKSTRALENGPWESFPQEFEPGSVTPTLIWDPEVTNPELISPLDAVKDLLGTTFWQFLGNARYSRRGESLLHWESYVGLSLAQLRSICLFLPQKVWPCLKGRTPLKDSFLGQSGGPLDFAFDSKTAPTDVEAQEYALLLRNRSWTGHDASLLLPYMAKAWELHNKAKSEQLMELASLYEKHPTILKPPSAPQRRPDNTQHIFEQLLRDSSKALFKTGRRSTTVREPSHYCQTPTSRYPWYRFRHPNAALVPYDDCIQLFCVILDLFPVSEKSSKYPDSLMSHLNIAQAGLRRIYSHGTPYAEDLLPRLTSDRSSPCVIVYENMEHGSVKPAKEIQWLKSFSACVAWMREAFGYDSRSVTQWPKKISVGSQLSSIKTRSVWEKIDYQHFVDTATPDLIATQLFRDSKLCDGLATRETSQRPSHLALYVPPYSSAKGSKIAQAVSSTSGVSPVVSELIYERLVDKVRRTVKQPHVMETLNSKEIDFNEGGHGSELKDTERLSHVDKKKLTITAAVLENLLQTTFKPGASVHSVLEGIQRSLSLEEAGGERWSETDKIMSWAEISRKYKNALPGVRPLQKKCYICRFTIASSHPTFPAMCHTCGDFNIEGSRFSLPHNLRLDGKVAFVTGGRINLGFHTALRLLRCGARVIVSSRYPRDAKARYEKQSDFGLWSERLKIVGADFRAAVDAFNLATAVRQIVVEWGGRLDILINNAAQTLTDSIMTERSAIKRELLLQGGNPSAENSLPSTSYVPRVRGGGVRLIEASSAETIDDSASTEASELSIQLQKTPKGTSWVQSLTEIPYEDVITAHSVNTFVPLILIRELMSLMKHDKASTKACGYIVNVSSREGIFETSRNGESKAGRHVHNNMSKAGLNMITETEAAAAWKIGIAMNTVDPGYMSASPEVKKCMQSDRSDGRMVRGEFFGQ